MLSMTITPRFNDTDALGHINNASYATWFEEARRPVFSYFVPDLDPKKWNLIIARIEIDYLAQGYFQKEALIKTYVEKIGNSSMVLVQEALQDNVMVAKSRSYMVHYDYSLQKSVPINEEIRKKLSAHLIS